MPGESSFRTIWSGDRTDVHDDTARTNRAANDSAPAPRLPESERQRRGDYEGSGRRGGHGTPALSGGWSPSWLIARRIIKAVDALNVDPRPSGARPLVGFPNLWRIRVGDYRVVYTIKDAELLVLVLRVAHRSSV
jgi:mRNA-degrading endonuclease RelE of RelBE toxin-antitoxin system